jgi:phosphoribosylanthranilate isomerase
VKIKVCGLRDRRNVREVLGLEPDFIGFIFYEGSQRCVSGNSLGFESNVKRVGVFVQSSLELIAEKVEDWDLDFVQLHGDESVEFCQQLRTLGIKVIKVFRIDEDFDWRIVETYENAADLFLFDTKGKSYGGLGKKFDWEQMKNYRLKVPFLLSGGIGPDDMEKLKALHFEMMIGIDVNSGFEVSPGFKDVVKLSECIKQIRNEISG